MPTFITTVKFTPQGLTKIQDTCKRAAALQANAKKWGAKILNVYWTPGPFDGLIIFEAPDGEAASAMMLNAAAQGFVQTQLTRAFTAAEMEKILAAAAK